MSEAPAIKPGTRVRWLGTRESPAVVDGTIESVHSYSSPAVVRIIWDDGIETWKTVRLVCPEFGIEVLS